MMARNTSIVSIVWLLLAWLNLHAQQTNSLLDAIHANNVPAAKQACEESLALFEVGANGNTPLHIAAQTGSAKMVALLLTFKPNIALKNDQNMSALDIAIANNHRAVVNVLLQYHDKSLLLNDGSVLHRSVLRRDIVALKEFLAQGYLVDLQNAKGQSALMLSAEQAHYPMFMLLIEQGASINLQDNEGHSVLFYARRGNNSAIIRYLQKELSHE